MSDEAIPEDVMNMDRERLHNRIAALREILADQKVVAE